MRVAPSIGATLFLFGGKGGVGGEKLFPSLCPLLALHYFCSEFTCLNLKCIEKWKNLMRKNSFSLLETEKL